MPSEEKEMATAKGPEALEAPRASSVQIGRSAQFNGTEYERFLELNEEFSGDRLKKLIRKTE